MARVFTSLVINMKREKKILKITEVVSVAVDKVCVVSSWCSKQCSHQYSKNPEVVSEAERAGCIEYRKYVVY